jgi:hypothetical protein
MPKRSSIDLVARVGKKGRVEAKKNPHAVALGRMGGLKGGVARAQKLTPERRREIARRAARARWASGEKAT